jgi:hypothetical protein
MDLGEIGWGGLDWIGLAQERENCILSKLKLISKKSTVTHPLLKSLD